MKYHGILLCKPELYNTYLSHTFQLHLKDQSGEDLSRLLHINVHYALASLGTKNGSNSTCILRENNMTLDDVLFLLPVDFLDGDRVRLFSTDIFLM